jgi:heptosyltransferase-2
MVCTQNDHGCMRDISAAEVVETAKRVLATAGRSAS